MKTIILNRSVESYFLQKQLNLKNDWCDIKLRPTAGEWVIYQYQRDSYLGFANLLVPTHFILKKIESTELPSLLDASEDIVATKSIQYLLEKSINYRLQVLPYGRNARLVFGVADYLPGLIIDGYENLILVQINTAGLDRFRHVIKEVLQRLIPNIEIVFFDSEKQRMKEQLPVHEKIKTTVQDLMIVDGRMKIQIACTHWQKNGYYYDHRDNREKFYRKLTELKLSMNNALDLFCYLGSWGITALQAGVKNVDFVDQADLGSQLDVNLQKNHLEGRGVFHRTDVFSFLDQKIQMKINYDVIVSDPPSFAKSLDKKPQAIQGYKKLHRKILSLIKPGGLVCFASCTHYVTFEEFESTIIESAMVNKRKLRLVDIGQQALDHPFVNFNDKSYYLKYFAYVVE